MKRRSLRDNQRHDGPLLASPKSEPILQWVSCTDALPENVVSIQEATVDGQISSFYVTRPTSKNSGFCITTFKEGDETSNCEILTDPTNGTEWKIITGKFNPRTYGALPANVEWRNEPNKYIGKICWEGGAVLVGTILSQKSVWKIRYLNPINLQEEVCVELKNVVDNVALTFEVLCGKEKPPLS